MSSSRFGGDDRPGMYEEGDDDDELVGESSSVSGGESDEEEGEDQFSEGGAEAASLNQMEHRRFVPQPLRRLNSDSIYDMSSMTAQLPAKKGLSRYYEGKSQSFACMSEVRCLEDLRKKEKPYQQKIKSCKTYAALGGIANAKTQSSSSCANLSMMAASGFRAPRIPVNKNGYHQ